MLILPPSYNLSGISAMDANITGVSGTNLTALEGHIISRSYNPGFVVLSFMISYVGAWTTMELLQKRTSWKGSYNWGLLLGAAISMGGIATWCMHFISTRAIILGMGEPQIQISYSIGYTALSFFIPVVVLMISFWTVGATEIVSIPRVCLGGILAGLGFSCMVYLGQAGISNYDCIYIVAYIIPSAIIACLASIVALFGLFYYRSNWITTWWKRALSGLIIAVGITGMHWLNIAGTEYQLKVVDRWPPSNSSRAVTVTVVIIFSSCGCLVLLFLSILAQTRRLRNIARAQQVVVAAAIFDADDRILVTPGGLLPSKKITNQFLERSFNDVFNASHPVFLWIYRISHNWPAISYLVPAIRRHIDAAGLGHQHLRSKSYANLMTEDGDPVEDYAIIFRELFCLATADLAIHLERDIDEMGILYEEITPTGHLSSSNRKARDIARGLVPKGRQPVDPERATINTNGAAVEKVGKGQLLFLVSRADKAEAVDLQAAGFRFAAKEMVLPMLSASLQIDDREVSRRIDLMLDYIGDSHILAPGIHISCFAIRASIGAGFDVLARKDAKNLLPTMQVSDLVTLEPWQEEYLKSMELLSVAATMKMFNKDSKPKNTNAEQRTFAKTMLATLEALKEEIDDPFFNDAQLIAKPIEAPCKGESDQHSTGVAFLITYKIIVPIHARAPGKKLEFVPLNLFRTQQRVYPNSPDHAHLARETFREFSKVLDMTGFDEESFMRANSPKSKFSFRKYATRKRSGENRASEPVDKDGRRVSHSGSGHLKPPATSKKKFWGKGHKRGTENSSASSQEGLIGAHDESADFERPSTSTEHSIEMTNLDKKPEPKKDEGEKRTYIDEMFAITIKTKEGAKV